MSQRSEFRRKGRATIIDVGRVAGVSDATVSRALNTPEKVSKATRQRVEHAIAETGYVPNPLAKAMVSGRTFTVGALVPTLDHAIFSRFLNALETELSHQSYNLVVAVTDGDNAVEVKKAEKLLSMGVEGLIVTGLSHNAELLARAQRAQVPLVATSYFEPTAALPTIGYDNERAAVLACDHLVALGHRNIAVIHGPVATNDRTRSRVDALRAMPPDIKLQFIETSLDYRGGGNAVTSWDPAVTAILCLSDVLAMGALFKLQAMGKQVPADVSLMGFDDMDVSAFLTPPLTTLHLPIAQMGRDAAQAVCRYLEEGTPIQSVELTARVAVRGSTAPLA
ncbi:LacI family DNA-binding transcriptional regulator [Yoonia sp. BS5-3]|uniref:LacI family DNA-binding transcriptional regulator n=1 Tax=Yoonia phaeophyticola TaxID=3137369 RepID=A0ABZ2V7L8_9RHOB